MEIRSEEIEKCTGKMREQTQWGSLMCIYQEFQKRRAKKTRKRKHPEHSPGLGVRIYAAPLGPGRTLPWSCTSRTPHLRVPFLRILVSLSTGKEDQVPSLEWTCGAQSCLPSRLRISERCQVLYPWVVLRPWGQGSFPWKQDFFLGITSD